MFYLSTSFTLAVNFSAVDIVYSAFLINHSWSYGLAAVASWIEYGLEATFLPQLKISYISHLGEDWEAKNRVAGEALLTLLLSTPKVWSW